MRRYAVPGVVLSLMFSACAVEPRSPPSKAGVEQVSTLELESLAGPVIRGFVAGGSGCMSLGTPVVAGNTVTIILTDYIAEENGLGISRSTCDVAVAIDLPPGFTISLDDVIYRGFADGSRARSTFFREYFFAGEFIGDRRFTVIDYDGAGNPSLVQNDSDDYTSDFGEFTARDRILSARFGGSVVWRANTALTVRNDFTDSFALAALDTVDLANRYFVTFRFGQLTGAN